MWSWPIYCDGRPSCCKHLRVVKAHNLAGIFLPWFYWINIWDMILKTWLDFHKQLSYPLIQPAFWLGVDCYVYKTFHVHDVFCACLESVWRFEWRTFYIGPFRTELICPTKRCLKWTNIESSSFKPPHRLRACTEKFTDMEFCIHNNQLPTKMLVELKDNPNIVKENQKFIQGLIIQVVSSNVPCGGAQ